MEKERYIIHNKRNRYYLLRDIFITLLLWALWLSLVYPLLSMIIWKTFDINILYSLSTEELEQLYQEVSELFVFDSIIIILLILGYTVWVYYNIQIYGGKNNRRKTTGKLASSMSLERALRVSPFNINVAQKSQYLKIYHADKSPKVSENDFEDISSHDFKYAFMYFSDDWDKVRAISKFESTYRKKRDIEYLLNSNDYNQDNKDGIFTFITYTNIDFIKKGVKSESLASRYNTGSNK